MLVLFLIGAAGISTVGWLFQRGRRYRSRGTWREREIVAESQRRCAAKAEEVANAMAACARPKMPVDIERFE
jgi:hypothetical protein